MKIFRRSADPAPSDAGQSPRVTLYVREGCHLCETAEAEVEQICVETGNSWERIDIDTDPELRQRFTEQVPVTFVDGAQHDFWRVDPERLRNALSRRPRRVT